MILDHPRYDVISDSGVAVDNVDTDVPKTFGDSRSNGLRDIRGADLVSNERGNIGEVPIARHAKRFALKSNGDPTQTTLVIYAIGCLRRLSGNGRANFTARIS